MLEVTWGLLLLLADLPALETNDLVDKNSPFYYDWESLQVAGLICAGILCLVGILFTMYDKCKCKAKEKHSPLPEKATPLISVGSTSAY